MRQPANRLSQRLTRVVIRTKRWPLQYPVHQLPAHRWDIRLNQLMLLALLALVAIWGWRRLFG